MYYQEYGCHLIGRHEALCPYTGDSLYTEICRSPSILFGAAVSRYTLLCIVELTLCHSPNIPELEKPRSMKDRHFPRHCSNCTADTYLYLLKYCSECTTRNSAQGCG